MPEEIHRVFLKQHIHKGGIAGHDHQHHHVSFQLHKIPDLHDQKVATRRNQRGSLSLR
ncbi:MAG: hypothetical protein UV13_C0018G0003 [Parcubacteria group bacterium GW2011_GWC1_42_21]|nr:MAG: hypothetical protein UV13_C0018G0003 [Parcubacteria group bacterium GW2011_GWC1_42_21]